MIPALLITVVLCGLRIAGATSPAYQAAAHLWCGGLIGAAIAMAFEHRRYLRLVYLAAVMIGVELAMFAVKEFR